MGRSFSKQDKDAELKATFTKVAADLKDNEAKIVAELNEIQGNAVEIGGYYEPNENLADASNAT